MTIAGRHMSVPDDLHAYITEKVERMFHHFGRELDLRVTVGVDGESHVVEMIAAAGHHHSFVAEARGEELHAVVDEAVDRLDRQLMKFKEKRRDRRRRPGTEPEVSANESEEEEA